jgi:uncharacterized protein (TIGR00299 family) protein
VRLAYFDCFSGISGDMALAALVHAGADLEAISAALTALPVEPFSLNREEVEVHGIAATRIQVDAGPRGVIRTYAGIRSMLDEAAVPDEARRTAHRIFRRLAEAAAKVHAKDIEFVTFQEFGEMDCLVDVVGSSLALHQLKIERVFASPVPTGLGMARTEHGIMPIPSPLVVELLHGAPTYSRGIPLELVTPAGAAILASVAEGYGDMPVMRADRVGYGAGEPRLDFPNVVRVVIGEDARAGGSALGPGPGTLVIETTLEPWNVPADVAGGDDFLAGLFDAGATDAWLTPALGLAGRARATVAAVASAAARDRVVEAIRGLPGAGVVRVTPAEGETHPPD